MEVEALGHYVESDYFKRLMFYSSEKWRRSVMKASKLHVKRR